MSSERAAPFAPKPPEGWDEHVRKTGSNRGRCCTVISPHNVR